MQTKAVPDELLSLREMIDELDEKLLSVLADRFEVTAKVGELKANQGLDSVDEIREKEKLSRLQSLAREKELNPDFVLKLYQMIFAEVVNNHRAYADRGSS